jgi:pimeloyl-ACP methyl ester carboxylesterase
MGKLVRNSIVKAATLLLVLSTAFLFTEGCRKETEPQRESSVSLPKTGFVDVGDTKLYYEEMGEGHPLVLLHGGLLDRRMWDPQFEAFAREYRVVRYDARNHGKSEGVPGPFTHFDDLAKLLDQLNIQQAALVGLSLGGRILIDFSIAHPERVSAIVLASPGVSGYEDTSEAVRANDEQMRRAFNEGDLPKAIEYFQRSWTDGPSRAPSDVDSVVRERIRSMALSTAENWNLESVIEELEPPAMGRLAEVRAPARVVVGDLDMPSSLEIAEAIDENVKGAEVVVMSGVAHMVNMERPEEFNEVVLEFLAKTLPD